MTGHDPSLPPHRRLVVGLGNPLAGDDAIGRRLAERLDRDPRLPGDIDVVVGSDLLRLQECLHDRREVLVLDATLDDQPPGTLSLFPEGQLPDDGAGGAHLLSPDTALSLLRVTDPALRAVPIRFALVSIETARVRDGLSEEVAGRFDDLVARLLALLD